MGSEQNKRNGLQRRGDGASGFAHQYTVVDLDIGADDLIARYAGTKRAAWVAEVVRACVQRQRTKAPPSDAFVRGLRRAKEVAPVVIIDLGRDGTKEGWEENPETGRKQKAGVNFCIVVDGRQRIMSRRINDKLDEADGKPPRMLDCDYMVPSAKTPYEDVVNFRVGSAVRVPRSFSARAEDAADMKRSNYALDDIAPMVEARDAAEVELLLALDRCVDEVKEAVDAGSVGLTAVARYAKMDPIKQVHAVKRKTAAPEGANGQAARKARDAAAAPRLKAKPGAYMRALAEHLPERTYDRDEVLELIEHLTGGATAGWLVGASTAAKEAT